MIRLMTNLIALVILSHQSLAVETIVKLTKEEQVLRVKNEKIIKAQIKKWKAKKLLGGVSLQSFKAEDIGNYQKTVPVLIKQCAKVAKGEAKVKAVIHKDKEYKKALKEYKKLSDEQKQNSKILEDAEARVISKFWDENNMRYAKVSWYAAMDEEELRCMTLEHIVKEYKKKNLILPVKKINNSSIEIKKK